MISSWEKEDEAGGSEGTRDKESGNDGKKDRFLRNPSTLVPSYPESSKASVK